MTVSIYGIKNCDTMKKARAWLDAQGVSYVFHDYRSEGVEPARLQGWIDALGWEEIVHCIAPENPASQKAARRLGASLRGPVRLPPPSHEVAVELWGQTRTQWQAGRAVRG